MKLNNLCAEIISYSFYLLFFSVPLFWLPVNYELFEFNKMLLVYFLTIIIAGAWVVKSIAEKKLIIKHSFLDIPILLFLLANFLSTVFSLDPHTSIFGYYGRWNGGLLSTVSYLFLYFAFVSNIDKKQIASFIWVILGSGILVAIYGILQHPNPFFTEKVAGKTIFHGIDHNYWAVDAENRVFSTLGQPNWLAAFLAMIIFPLLSFLLVIKTWWKKILLFAGLSVCFLAFTFTYSRGGTVGLLLGLATFVILLPMYKETLIEKVWLKLPIINLKFYFNRFKNYLGVFLAILVMVLIVNQYFGNALSRRGGLATSTSQTSTQTQKLQPKPTALEEGGTQTAKIRTIVWNGSLNIFLHYPIFGSGVETFGYSYYLFRPAEHNLTAEWDYLYNKAHNEYLNYLATTGAFGIITYLALIALFEFAAIKKIVGSGWDDQRFISLGLLSAYNGYLLQNFFGFSVVAIALLFYLLPALFVVSNDLNKKEFVVFSLEKVKILNSKLGQYSLILISLLVSFYLLLAVLSTWTADFLYNKSLSSEDYQSSIQELRLAAKLNPGEPIYQAELAINLSGLASASKNKSLVKNSEKETRQIIDKLVTDHPNNTALWQTKRQIDFTLSQFDKVNYLELLASAERLKKLAPTDASIQYDVALVYSFVEKPKEAEKQLEKVVSLKQDYADAVLMLGRIYKENGKTEKAIALLTSWLKTNPNDIQAQELLKSLK